MDTDSITAAWQVFLDADERVILSGVVMKRVLLFSKQRQLLLTNRPRLLYIDTDKMVLKGQIPWGNDASTLEVILLKGERGKSFDLKTPGRTYHLTDVMSSAARWKISIEKLQAEQRGKAAALNLK